MNDSDKLKLLLRHIENVRKAGEILGERLISSGEDRLGLKLIRNCQVHDLSKFTGIEWEFLFLDPSLDENKANLAMAIHQHNSTNLHHPESWDSIHEMPPVYVAEMVCDWKARSSEFGTSLMEYINGKAMERFKFNAEDEVYGLIMRFVNLLCDKPFVPIVAAEV